VGPRTDERSPEEIKELRPAGWYTHPRLWGVNGSCELLRLSVLPMSEVTQILSAIEQGDSHAAEQLLPLVYEELRNLAAQKLAQEKPGQTLQATALVHEAYLRLVDVEKAQRWDSRGHFFAAAAEAMRRILIDRARGKQAARRGGGRRRVELAEVEVAGRMTGQEVLELDDALLNLAEHDRAAAELVKLRLFAGLSVEEAGKALGLPRTTAYRQWTYARAWLRARMGRDAGSSGA
jgi:RNA polymerase sigma factor (TIGR02999 family)